MEKIKVLIAEDQQILRDNLKKMLEKTNKIEVVYAVDSAKQAIIMTQKLNPEIVLMDIEMESSDSGLLAAKTIFDYNHKIKIIFLTMHREDKLVIEALNIGAVDYVVKTSDCKNAIEHIIRAHEDKIVLDSAIQNIFHTEYLKLAKNKNENLLFVQKIILLTVSERAIIFYLLKGKKLREISEIRHVEMVTIKKQITAILKKLDAKRTKNIIEKINQLELDSLFKDDLR